MSRYFKLWVEAVLRQVEVSGVPLRDYPDTARLGELFTKGYTVEQAARATVEELSWVS